MPKLPPDGDDSKFCYSWAELLEEDERDPHRFARRCLESLKYWKYDPKHKVLFITPDGYWIPLNRITCNAQIVDWLCQLANKSWVTPEILGELVIAINALLDPQMRLCSSGHDKGEIDAERIAQSVYESAMKGAR